MWAWKRHLLGNVNRGNCFQFSPNDFWHYLRTILGEKKTLLNHWGSSRGHRKFVKVLISFLSDLTLEDFSRTWFLRWLENIWSPVLNFLWSVYISLFLCRHHPLFYKAWRYLKSYSLLAFVFPCFPQASYLISSQETGFLSVFILIILVYIHSSFDSSFLNSLNQNCVLYSRWTFSCALFVNDNISHSSWK